MVGDDIEDTMAPPNATTLEGIVDVFQPLPCGLPLEWEMAHIIPLEPYINHISSISLG